MTRFFFAALAFATLGLAGPAAAEDCFCVGPDLFSNAFPSEASSELEGAEGNETREMGLDSDLFETPDPLTEVPVATPEIPRGPVLWCISPDDPRCQRDDSGEAPHRSSLASSLVASLGSISRITRASSITLELVLIDETRPLSGIRGRIDRPPRT
jgi:hypothetical protein